MIRRILRLAICASIILNSQFSILHSVQAQTEWTPQKSNRLVNDYSGMLSPEQQNALENRLVAFNDSTSNQIVIVITPTLHGDASWAVATRIGQQWGVGQKEFDNGVVILIKSKSEEERDGDVAIATGYGVEGALPDVFCKRIIDDIMVEPLSNGDYYKALVAALDIIEPVLRGEYSYAQYRKEERREAIIGLLVFVGLIAIVSGVLFYYAKKHPDQWKGGNNGNGSGNNGGVFFGGCPIGFGGGRGGGSWGGGFGGGGFGGFGGGGFGGGGASGKF